MLICILGLSASGKDYAAKMLSSKYNLNHILQFTTRPKRSNELDGIDYYFIDEVLFKKMIREKEFISYRVFRSHLGDWYYGIRKKCMEVSENSIICIDVEGLQELIEKYNKDDIISIFIEADYDIRKERAEKRSNSDIKEFNRRYKDDLSKLDRIKEKCNYILCNNGLDNFTIEICNVVEQELKL